MLEDVAGFVAWLRLPPAARSGKVAVLPTVEHHCSAASVNRKLAALISFCEFHSRHGVRLSGLLVTMQPAGRRGAATSYKPFLHHITKNQPVAPPRPPGHGPENEPETHSPGSTVTIEHTDAGRASTCPWRQVRDCRYQPDCLA